MNLRKISKHRKRVSNLKIRRNRLEKITMGRKPMVAASFITRRLRQDAPLVHYLSASIGGESRHRYVRKGEIVYWRKRALKWRKFSRAMASWVKVNKEIEKELREIGRLRCEELPGGMRDRKEGDNENR
ncbi:hypothetical protein KAX75_00060 [candidate division WOR-3 bacterium]|nr:hypothetical protein [candidate division WOR-3 bacterium]